jgi:hypothetical protein
VAEKRSTLKTNIEAKQNPSTFTPKINVKPKGAEKRQETSVFERLYALKDKENT